MAERGVIERVQWTGYLPVEQVPAALLGADVVVLPYRDGISFRRGSLHAALALGCPVLSTQPRVPIPELIDGDNVRLVSPDDPGALCEAALDLAHDLTLRARIGRGAKALAEQFTWERIARRTVGEVFVPLASARRGR
jgi:glycosyltransferase involved in cell wall biosynthesis